MAKLYFVVFLSAIFWSCNRLKAGYINPVEVTHQYDGLKAKLQQFQATVAPWQANIDTLTAELNRASARYEAEKPKLPPKEAEGRRAALAQQEQQLVQYREAVTQKATAERQRLDKEALDEINAYIKEYGKREGYDFILGATTSGNIVYAAEGTDITADVLKGLNERYRQQHQERP